MNKCKTDIVIAKVGCLTGDSVLYFGGDSKHCHGKLVILDSVETKKYGLPYYCPFCGKKAQYNFFTKSPGQPKKRIDDYDENFESIFLFPNIERFGNVSPVADEFVHYGKLIHNLNSKISSQRAKIANLENELEKAKSQIRILLHQVTTNMRNIWFP